MTQTRKITSKVVISSAAVYVSQIGLFNYLSRLILYMYYTQDSCLQLNTSEATKLNKKKRLLHYTIFISHTQYFLKVINSAS